MLDPDPSPARFVSAVEAELALTAARHGRAGVGVMTGTYASAIGVPLDAVALVGGVEGQVPKPFRGGAVLGPREYELVGRDLSGSQVDDQHRQYLAALAAAPLSLVTWSRHEMRSGRAAQPSRWLSASTLTSNSFVASAELPLPLLSAAELRSAGLFSASQRSVEAVAESPWLRVNSQLARGALMIEERRRGRYGPFTGQAWESARLPQALAAEQSATSLEAYATCPASWFFQHVLKLKTVDRPEAVLRLAPDERGSLIHRVLEALITERISGAAAGSPEERARARQLLSEELGLLTSLGRTARGVLAEFEQDTIELQLGGFEQLDENARRGATAQLAELEFGADVGRPVNVVLPSGRSIRLRGAVDRVDLVLDGVALVLDGVDGPADGADGAAARRVVIDYKTGRAPRSVDMAAALVTGEKLQPVLYALAVEQASPGPPVDRAEYWHLPNTGPSVVPVDLPAIRDGAVAAIEDLMTSIEAGNFPARPGEATTWPSSSYEHCTYCSFDPICPSYRSEVWESVRTESSLDLYRTRVEGPADPADPADPSGSES